MKILRAYKTKLRPTQVQARYFAGCAGAARFVFNQLPVRRGIVPVELDRMLSTMKQEAGNFGIRPVAYHSNVVHAERHLVVIEDLNTVKQEGSNHV